MPGLPGDRVDSVWHANSIRRHLIDDRRVTQVLSQHVDTAGSVGQRPSQVHSRSVMLSTALLWAEHAMPSLVEVAPRCVV